MASSTRRSLSLPLSFKNSIQRRLSDNGMYCIKICKGNLQVMFFCPKEDAEYILYIYIGLYGIYTVEVLDYST